MLLYLEAILDLFEALSDHIQQKIKLVYFEKKSKLLFQLPLNCPTTEISTSKALQNSR